MLKQVNKIKENQGITLVALVITIIILIILSTAAISAIFLENGLIYNAQKGKKEQEKAEARERLSIVLADAYLEKMMTTEYTGEEFLEKHLEDFVYGREPNAEIFKEDGVDYISLNGYIFELDRSVPELGDYDGEEGNRPPKIRDIGVTNKTLSEISVEVTSARADGATYKYSIKKLAEEDTAYEEKESNGGNTYTYTGLTSPEKYTIKVELEVDGEVIDTKTQDVILGELEKGAIEFTDIKWNSGTASVTVSTTTSYQLQYQVVAGEGKIEDNSWKIISNGGKISNIPNNSTVYARLLEGTNASDYASVKVEENIKPTITKFEATEITWNSIKVQVNATDNQSGLSSTNTYKFYLNDETTDRGTSTDGTFTYENLSGLTSYKLRVEVYDNAGNKEEKEINATTKELTLEDALDITSNKKIYVEIPSKKGGTILCNVLYNDETNGLQIISVNSVETVTLSGKDTYNDVINILNKKAEEYNYFGNDYVDARCVGCSPVKDKDLGYESGTGEKNFWGHTMKNADTKYEADYNKMTELGITNSNVNYWLASRFVYTNSGSASYFRVRMVFTTGKIGTAYGLCVVHFTGNTGVDSNSFGLRPVFILKSGIKITGGDGSSDSPYTLEI